MRKYICFLSLFGLWNNALAQETNVNSVPYSFVDMPILQQHLLGLSNSKDGEYIQIERNLAQLIQIDIDKLNALLAEPVFTISEHDSVFQEVKGKFLSEQSFSTLFDNLSLRNDVQYPYQFLRLDYSNQEIGLLFYLYFSDFFRQNPQYRIQLKPKMIELVTGKKVTEPDFFSKQNIENKQDNIDSDVFPILKSQVEKSELPLFVFDLKERIKNLQLLIEYPTFKKNEYKIENRLGEHAINGNKINVVEVKDDFLILELPAELANHILVKESHRDSYLTRSETQVKLNERDRKNVQEWLNLLKQAHIQVKQGKLARESELQDYLNTHKPKKALSLEQSRIQIAYYYEHKPAEIILQITELDSLKTIEKDIALVREDLASGYFVAGVVNSEKTGVMNNQGNWLVNPDYFRLRMINPYYFADEYHQYHFNPEDNALSKVNYNLNDATIYMDNWVKVEFDSSYILNLANIKTGQLAFNRNYEYLDFIGKDFLIAKEADTQKFGVFRSDLSMLLPFEFSHINYEAGFFYTNKRDRKGETISDVYNAQGKNITNGKYQEIHKFNDGLLLVRRMVDKKDKKTGASEYESYHYVIDEMGKEVLNLTKLHLLSTAERFSVGLLAVQDGKTEKYGFIDRQGKWVISPRYHYATPFFMGSKYALVELNDPICNKNNTASFALIDTKGKIKKCFSDVTDWNWRSEDHEFIYSNGIWYDDFGRPTRTEKE